MREEEEENEANEEEKEKEKDEGGRGERGGGSEKCWAKLHYSFFAYEFLIYYLFIESHQIQSIYAGPSGA